MFYHSSCLIRNTRRGSSMYRVLSCNQHLPIQMSIIFSFSLGNKSLNCIEHVPLLWVFPHESVLRFYSEFFTLRSPLGDSTPSLCVAFEGLPINMLHASLVKRRECSPSQINWIFLGIRSLS